MDKGSRLVGAGQSATASLANRLVEQIHDRLIDWSVGPVFVWIVYREGDVLSNHELFTSYREISSFEEKD